MLPADKGITQARVRTFWAYVKEAYTKAEQIVVGRQSSRDLYIQPWEKMCYAEASFTTFIFHKAARLVSMVEVASDPAEHGNRELEEKIDDELLDIINYAAMHYAYRRLAREAREEKPCCS